MLIALVNMGMSVTDTLMVSAAFGAEALAAVAVGSDFYSILFYLGAGTIGGLAPFYAAAVARRTPPNAPGSSGRGGSSCSASPRSSCRWSGPRPTGSATSASTAIFSPTGAATPAPWR
jgi:hypothetical protein